MKLPNVSPATINEIAGEGVMSLKGKDYMQVQHRTLRHRFLNPDITYYTETVSLTVGYDDNGNPIQRHWVKTTVAEGYDVRATAHKEIKFDAKGGAAKDFPLETAETGALGRALSMCGVGTLAGDLDEDDQLADAPLLTGK